MLISCLTLIWDRPVLRNSYEVLLGKVSVIEGVSEDSNVWVIYDLIQLLLRVVDLKIL